MTPDVPTPPIDVWFLSTGLAAGGAERALATLAPRLAAHGVRATVFSLSGEGRFGPELRAAGLEVVDLGISDARRALSSWRRLGARARDRRPTLLQGWMYHGNLLATAVSAISGIPSSWAVRQSLADFERSPVGLRATIRVGAILSGLPRGVLYNSRVALEQHRELGFTPPFAEVIPNGFDLERFRPDPAARARVRGRLGLAPDAILLVNVARFHPVKGLDVLLDAFGAIAGRARAAHLLLVGRGMDAGRPELVRAIGSRGLGTSVLPLGEVDDVAEILAAADVAVQASLGEGFPNAVGEAMACGTPVAATRAGDTAALAGGAAILVPPGSAGELAAAIAAWLELGPEERARRGAAGRERIAAEFGADRGASRLAAYLRRAAEGRR